MTTDVIPGRRHYQVLPEFADAIERLPVTVLHTAWPAWRKIIDAGQQRRFGRTRTAVRVGDCWWLTAEDVAWLTSWVAGVSRVEVHELELMLSEHEEGRTV